MNIPRFAKLSDAKGAVLNLAQRNTSVLIGANVVTLVIRLFSTIILTRLLEPAAFGTIAIIGTVQTVLVIASDVGFYPYVVRDSRVAETRFLDQIWTLRLIRALILGGITLAIARPTALYVGVSDLELALQITALQPIVEGLSSMAFATAARGGEIKKLSMLDLIIALTQAVLSILLSVIWRDFWGMVIAATACSFLKTFLSYYLFSESRRRWNYSYEQSKQLWSFGRHILPSSMISLIIGQADKVALSRLLSVHTFGLYSVAGNIALLPISLMNSYTSRILFPIFSNIDIKNINSIKNVYYNTGILFQRIITFCFGLFIGMSEFIINLLYDERYYDSSYYLKILSVMSVLSYRVSLQNEILVAIGMARVTLLANTVRLVSLLFAGCLLFYFLNPISIIFALPFSLLVAHLYMFQCLYKSDIIDIKIEIISIFILISGFATGEFLNMIANNLNSILNIY